MKSVEIRTCEFCESRYRAFKESKKKLCYACAYAMNECQRLDREQEKWRR